MSHLAAVLAYVASTLLVQGISHLQVNRAHYAGTGLFRDTPVLALGLLAMLVQGGLMTVAYACAFGGTGLWPAMLTSWAFGAFLGAYMALGLAGEMKVPDIRRWVAVEGAAAAMQFTLAGLGLWAAHRFL